MERISAVVAHIYSLIKSSRNHQIRGTELSPMLRHQFPDFSPERYGCHNLRDFIRRYGTQVTEIGRAGMDFVYGLAEIPGISPEPEAADGIGSPTSSNEPPRINIEQQYPAHKKPDYSALWKTFARPQSKHILCAQTQSGRLVVLPPGSTVPGDMWRRIPACSAETHISIAKEFIESLRKDEHKRRLSELLGRSRWWVDFYYALQDLGFTAQWNGFRTNRILQELKNALTTMGIPTTEVPQPVFASKARARVGSSGVSHDVASVDFDKKRALAAKLIQKMSNEDLRALNVRLGDVFDSLGF